MRNAFFIISLLISIVVSFQTIAQSTDKPLQGNWTKGPSERFLGDVWVEYFINDSVSDFIASRVLFEPKSRSNWHKHSGKQIIFGIVGEGFFKEKGKPLVHIKKGDLVEIPPGVIHSHGSISKQFMQGVMMNDVSKKESSVWLSPVLEEELYEK